MATIALMNEGLEARDIEGQRRLQGSSIPVTLFACLAVGSVMSYVGK